MMPSSPPSQRQQPFGFSFINVAHPDDATKPEMLSQIRSHATKDMRARARKARLRTRCSHSPTATGNTPHHTTEPKGILDEDCNEAIPPLLASRPQWNAVRDLSDRELFLIDHYINYDILASQGHCTLPLTTHKNNNTSSSSPSSPPPPPTFTQMQLHTWLPFALSDPGLLASLLLHSCRTLYRLRGSSGYEELYRGYRLECIRRANGALGDEGRRVSDGTVALVMVLVSDSFGLGRFEEWKVHLKGFTSMVVMRGGIDALGVDGFLKQLVLKAPQFYGRWET